MGFPETAANSTRLTRIPRTLDGQVRCVFRIPPISFVTWWRPVWVSPGIGSTSAASSAVGEGALKSNAYAFNHPKSDGTSVHAEIAALRKLPPRPLNKAPLVVDVVVLRVIGNGVLANSKPCCNCIASMQGGLFAPGYRVRYCYYSDKDGNIQRELVEGMTSNHTSRGNRYANCK